jgi:hypothetical protein
MELAQQSALAFCRSQIPLAAHFEMSVLGTLHLTRQARALMGVSTTVVPGFVFLGKTGGYNAQERTSVNFVQSATWQDSSAGRAED